tara:strand:+ start:2947 stop:3282 length:336 start_codon:yes stop_codon:yes gene_type:complete
MISTSHVEYVFELSKLVPTTDIHKNLRAAGYPLHSSHVSDTLPTLSFQSPDGIRRPIKTFNHGNAGIATHKLYVWFDGEQSDGDLTAIFNNITASVNSFDPTDAKWEGLPF